MILEFSCSLFIQFILKITTTGSLRNARMKEKKPGHEWYLWGGLCCAVPHCCSTGGAHGDCSA